MQMEGLAFLVADVPTSRCETRGAKPLLDAVYRELLTESLAGRLPGDFRVVIDNYGVGRSLCDWLKGLDNAGAEMIPSPMAGCPRNDGTHADDRYVEVRLASVMARYHRELALASVPGDVPLGTMNTEFKQWLQRHRAKGQPLPTFLKRWVSSLPW